MKKPKIFLLMYLIITPSVSIYATDSIYSTVKIDGIHATSSGVVAINLGKNIPTGLNPSTSVWERCKNNWVFIHKDNKGNKINEKYVDRMLSVSLASFKSNTSVRLNIKRDSLNNCYSSQIYDLGK